MRRPLASEFYSPNKPCRNSAKIGRMISFFLERFCVKSLAISNDRVLNCLSVLYIKGYGGIVQLKHKLDDNLIRSRVQHQYQVFLLQIRREESVYVRDSRPHFEGINIREHISIIFRLRS